jgi:hypothetical protein
MTATETSNIKNLPGLYRHQESGAEIEVSDSAIADGLVRVGYVRVEKEDKVQKEGKK